MAKPRYDRSVFLNVPFDAKYERLFRALVFAVYDCGFVPRSALEAQDSTQPRILKLYELIAQSKYGIHDISRTQLTGRHRLPRFNMPLELGLFLGAKAFGTGQNKAKVGLVLDKDRYRYQEFVSDIAGQDIRAHSSTQAEIIRCVRDWLRSAPDISQRMLPGSRRIHDRFRLFTSQLPSMCEGFDLSHKDLSFLDYRVLVGAWVQTNPP